MSGNNLSFIPFKLRRLTVCSVFRKRNDALTKIGDNLNVDDATKIALRCANVPNQTAVIRIGQKEVSIIWRDSLSEMKAGHYCYFDDDKKIPNLSAYLKTLLVEIKKEGRDR